MQFNAVLALAGGIVPIGLVLAAANPENPCEADILSIFVNKNFRNKGICKSLLETIEADLVKSGFKKIFIIYNYKTSATGIYLKKALSKNGFSDPENRYFLFKVNVQLLRSGNFFKKSSLIDKYNFFKFADLGKDDCNDFLGCQTEDEKNEWIGFNPFGYLNILEPCNSIGIKINNEYAGWVITVKNGENSLAYSVLFVRKKYRKTPVAVALMKKSLLLQYENNFTIATCLIQNENIPMLNMFNKRFGYALIEENQSVISSKFI
jgi:GNAT superfamily N-acetyltransferase